MQPNSQIINKFHRLLQAALLFACAVVFVTPAATFASWNDGVPSQSQMSEKLPLWMSYLQAGEQSQKAGKLQLAKRYYLGALSQLENISSGQGRTMQPAMMLEQHILQMYPSDWAQAKGDQAEKLKLREEQVAVLARINKFNQTHTKNKMLIGQYQRMYESASKNLEQERSGTPVGQEASPGFFGPSSTSTASTKQAF